MIEIVTSMSGKVNTGNYENVDPFFSIKEVLDIEMTDQEKVKRQHELHLLCKKNFDQAVNVLKGVESKSDLDIRISGYPTIYFFDMMGNKVQYNDNRNFLALENFMMANSAIARKHYKR